MASGESSSISILGALKFSHSVESQSPMNQSYHCETIIASFILKTKKDSPPEGRRQKIFV